MKYFPISPLILRPDFRGPFDIYLRHDNNYVLFNAQNRLLSQAKRDELAATDIDYVYIEEDSLKSYNAYLRANLMGVLNDENIPLNHRSQAWANAATALAKELFEINLPGPAFKKRYNRFEELINNSASFVQSPLSLKHITRFINKGYDTYQHGVSTMVYAVNLIQEYDFEDCDSLACGMGALLHDIGKVGLPENIVNADPSGLSPDEFAVLSMHPMIGVRNCANFNLPIIATNCILFHHERADGKGYPTQATHAEIPLPIRIVALCDRYDNLTRNRPFKRALKPFDALKVITDDKGLVEPDMLKRFIGLLSRAEIV
ncbi:MULTISPECIES: HD domain-containing phosphohydrolase [unclassified Pseudodesulfovibrio]|uniref:HD-GYP domain-containing protein n=1 Tax=unclassified Pseudodesulfovibrio TaxID=2661612 RepID=UPI001F4F395D|nr:MULTISPECIES: HD domain-containing phosphohydrolase [unclassified Pseudodesulfovibrio]